MLKDLYSIPYGEKRYDENTVELTNELDVIIQQIDLILFTNRGDVLMRPEFGCNLEQYLFETSCNEAVVKSVIMEQIRNYVYMTGTYNVEVDVSFVEWEYNYAMVVDLTINNRKIASYLV